LDGYSFMKVGLAGCGEWPDWPSVWRIWARSLPAAVAVVYADYQAAAAPCPRRILDVATQEGAKAVLVDTYDKTQGDLFRHFAPAELLEFVREVQGFGMLAVLGGSLRVETLPLAVATGADIIAVRGAACGGSRESSIDEKKVQQLVEALVSSSPQHAAQASALNR
jgi:uncharacterized protein (UPF0264 family)